MSTSDYYKAVARFRTDYQRRLVRKALAHGWTVEEFRAFIKLRYPAGSLAEHFGAPPFSVLDAKQGYWLRRQRAWQELGISGVAGRGEDHVPALAGTLSILGQCSGIRTETSVFNCALTEIAYHWFAPVRGGCILDPFAGGSTRGIIAAKLGYHYTGVELCAEQV